MVAFKFVALFATTFVGLVSTSAVEEDWVLTLLKRQEPGTPAYACHSSCGNAITKSRGSDPCNDSTFVSEYTACIACSGPSDVNIWRYYGRTLSVAGGRCGLPTDPSAASPSTSTLPIPSVQPVTASSTQVEPSSVPVTTSTLVNTVPTSQVSAPSTVVSTPSQSSSTAPAPTTAPIVISPTGTTPSSNGTSATSSAIQFTGGADSKKVFGIGSFAAAVFAFMI